MPAAGGTAGERRLNASYDDRPHVYDELRTAGHMARRRIEFFTAVVDRCPGPVLEIGSGTGTLLRQLAAARPDRTFTGVEPLPNYVEFANARAREAGLDNVRFVVGTGESLPVSDQAAPRLILSVDALHHVDDLDRVIAEIARVTRPGARWLAMEPNRWHPYVWGYHVLTPGERTFAVRDFQRRAQRLGWQLVRTRSLFGVPGAVSRLPAWAERLERRIEKVRPLAGGVAMEFLRLGSVTDATGR